MKIWLWSGFFFLISACVHEKDVHIEEIEIEPETGGIISVNPPRDPKAREQINSIMKANCGKKKPKIIKEGFVKVTSRVSRQDLDDAADRATANTIIGGFSKASATMGGTQSSVPETAAALNAEEARNLSRRKDVEISEWRVQYKCL